MWNSVVRQHGRAVGGGEVVGGVQRWVGGGGAGRNFWSSSATVFFSHRPFSVFGRKHEQETPQSPDCSLIIPSNEREGARRKTHANCTSSTQPAYGVEPRGWKNPYGTIKLIVSSPFFSFFSPYRVHLYSSHHLQREEWEQKKKEEGEGGRETDRGSRATQSIPIFVRLPRHPGRKRAKETKEADGWQDGVEG